MFSLELAESLLPYKIIDYTINIIEGKEPPYRPIYPLSPTKLKELWVYL